MLLCAEGAGNVTGDWSLGTTIGIRAKFESPESHRSDFGGERKPISNSDQIQSAQKWRFEHTPDSSRRDEALAPNRVKIGRWTHPYAPPEVSACQIHAPHARPRAPKEEDEWRSRAHAPGYSTCTRHKCLISTEKPFLSFLGIPDSLRDADYALGKPRMRNEMNRKTIGQIRQCIGHEHDETSAHGLWTKLKKMYREKTSQNKALMRRLVLKLQRGTTVEELISEFQRKGQRRGPDKKVREGQGRGPEKRSEKRTAEVTIQSSAGDALGYVQKFVQTRVVQPVQDVHREAQRKETKKSYTATGVMTPN
ncbi:hypothetical protein Acr_00g0060870 [Actinidia rufa]|uniref:Uncharacterized protein n=1 Tax=Actinidia rufa TaxID=165716 RepID=A0A7J0DNR9_9ERIC|nr:hypothetical protein Acr_00g0060870 [Actinidia rufa]